MTFNPYPKPIKAEKKTRKRLKAKHHPTSKADAAYMAWIKEHVCACCGRWGVDVHHTTLPRHENHDKTIPLCFPMGDDNGCHWLRHNRKRTFTETYGSDKDMAEKYREMYKQEKGA